MLHEIQMAEEQIRSEEDKILEIMEEMENKEKRSQGRGTGNEKEVGRTPGKHPERQTIPHRCWRRISKNCGRKKS